MVADGDCGWLFEPGDALKLAELLWLLGRDRELREQFGVAARQHVVAEFSLKRMLESYRDLYLELSTKRGLFRSGRDIDVRD